MKHSLAHIRHVALDMDGTIYSGTTLFNTTLPFLKTLAELEIGYTFLTNNPSKSVDDYLSHLAGFGIPANASQLYTSAQATIEHLQQELPKTKKLFLIGTPSMCCEFKAAGFELLPDSPEAEPDAVVIGFDLTLTYSRLCRAAWWIKNGKPFIATNPDRVCPTNQPTVLIDCGSICACLREATGRAPDKVLGKPDPTMLGGILHRHGLQAHELAMVGDRLYTDMEMARRAGALGVLVLTGEATSQQAHAASTPPDLIVADLDEFAKQLRAGRTESISA